MKYYYLPLKASLLSIVIVLITSCTNVMLVPFKQHYYTPDDLKPVTKMSICSLLPDLSYMAGG